MDDFGDAPATESTADAAPGDDAAASGEGAGADAFGDDGADAFGDAGGDAFGDDAGGDAFGDDAAGDAFGDAPAEDAAGDTKEEGAAAFEPQVDDDAGYTAEPAAKEDEGEPQYNALREFNEQWRLQLDQKAQLAREEQEVLRTAAAEDIKKMYVENESNREQRQAANRQSEQKFLEDMESQLEVASENPWQRVTSLIETNPNPEVNTQDVARMRSILVHLKNSDSGPAIPSEE